MHFLMAPSHLKVLLIEFVVISTQPSRVQNKYQAWLLFISKAQKETPTLEDIYCRIEKSGQRIVCDATRTSQILKSLQNQSALPNLQ